MNALRPHHRDGLLTGLALAGFCVAVYLTLFQLGLFPTVWEPLFADGSRLVLHSPLSSTLPIPDAALGAIGYLAEALCVTVRSRAGPWATRVYNTIVAVFTAVSIALVALQWGYFHAWCTLCLTSAVLSFIIAGVVLSEARKRRE